MTTRNQVHVLSTQIPPRRSRRRLDSLCRLACFIAFTGWVGAAQAMPYISELYYDAPGSDDGLSFIEIAGVPGTSLDAVSIENVNGSNGAVGPTIALSGSIGAGGLFVVADRTSEGTTSVLGADLLANFDFQNGPDSVVIRVAGVIVDSLGYGDFSAGEVFAGEGLPAPDVQAGQSLARHFANLDTDDNSLDFAILDVPTPGVATFLPIPEPTTAVLFGLGLAGLGSAGRRCNPERRSIDCDSQ